jgi:hypothetical protein
MVKAYSGGGCGPMNLLTVIESLLRDRELFFGEIRDGKAVRQKIIAMLFSCFVFLAGYGAVMGAAHSFPQTAASFLKLPTLFLATLAICAPSLHFFNVLFGSNQTGTQTVALILTAISTTAVLLFSLAPITLFFLLSSSEYVFFKLLNVVFFVIAGGLGAMFLRQGMRIVTETGDDQADSLRARRLIFAIWIVLYGFVGSQMAWTLRPFIGQPDKDFILFSHSHGNIYTDVIESLRALLGF